MATTTYDFEGGTDGSAANATSTGWNTNSSAGTGGAITHDAGMAVSGAVGLKFVCGTTAACVAEFSSFTSATQEATRFAYTLPASPFTSTSNVVNVYGGSDGNTAIFRVQMTTANLLIVTDLGNAHTSSTILDMSPYMGTKVGFGVTLDTGTTATNGTAQLRVYADPMAAAGTYVATFTSGAAYNLGSVTGTAYPVTRYRVGICSTQTAVRTVGVDYLQLNSGSVTFLGPPPSVSAPTADAGTDQDPQAGDTITLNSSASTGTGTLTRVWSCIETPAGAATPAITNPTMVSPTVTLPNAGRYRFQVVVTQAGGATGTATVTEWVHPAPGADVMVYSLNGATIWTNEGGAASIVSALNDSLTTTYALSPSAPAGDSISVIMCPFGLGVIKLIPENNYSGAVITRRLRVYKADGTSLVYDTNAHGLDWVLTSTPTEVTVTVDASGLAAIPTLADRRALRVTITDTA